MVEIKNLYSENTEFYFLVGSDFIQNYKTWKDYERLLTLANFVIAVRPGFSLVGLPEGMRLLEGDFPYISSRDIRIIVKSGDNVSQQMPSKVFNYIKKNKLYV